MNRLSRNLDMRCAAVENSEGNKKYVIKTGKNGDLVIMEESLVKL